MKRARSSKTASIRRPRKARGSATTPKAARTRTAASRRGTTPVGAYSGEDVSRVLKLPKGASSVELKLSVPAEGHRAAAIPGRAGRHRDQAAARGSGDDRSAVASLGQLQGRARRDAGRSLRLLRVLEGQLLLAGSARRSERGDSSQVAVPEGTAALL